MAFTSIIMGDITYESLVTLPPEFAILDLLTIQLWGGRPAYLYQVRHPCGLRTVAAVAPNLCNSIALMCELSLHG